MGIRIGLAEADHDHWRARHVYSTDPDADHALNLMCDDIEGFVAEMKTRMLGVYQPRHARPEPMA